MNLTISKLPIVCVLVLALMFCGLIRIRAQDNEMAAVITGVIAAILVVIVIASSPSRAETEEVSPAEPVSQESIRKAYVAGHPELNEQTKQAILNGEILIGMTKEQLIASWGDPLEINTIRTAKKQGREEFVYPDNQYVYIEDGMVTEIRISIK